MSGLRAPRWIDHFINELRLNDLLSRLSGRRRQRGEMSRASCKGNRSAELGFAFRDVLHRLEIYVPATSGNLAFSWLEKYLCNKDEYYLIERN
jgi:hypothetical protein